MWARVARGAVRQVRDVRAVLVLRLRFEFVVLMVVEGLALCGVVVVEGGGEERLTVSCSGRRVGLGGCGDGRDCGCGCSSFANFSFVSASTSSIALSAISNAFLKSPL